MPIGGAFPKRITKFDIGLGNVDNTADDVKTVLSATYATYVISGSGSGSPTGDAGGDLTGTYPNPTIANSAITPTKANLTQTWNFTGLLQSGSVAVVLTNDTRLPPLPTGLGKLVYDTGLLYSETINTTYTSQGDLNITKHQAGIGLGLHVYNNLGQSHVSCQNDVTTFYFGADKSTSAFAGGGFIYTQDNRPLTMWTNNTKRLTIEGNGGVTLATTIAMGTNKITGVGEPTLAQDAATKNYVDSLPVNASSIIAMQVFS